MSVSTFAEVWVHLLLPVLPKCNAGFSFKPIMKTNQFLGPYYFPLTENPSYETRTRVLYKVNGICLLPSLLS